MIKRILLIGASLIFICACAPEKEITADDSWLIENAEIYDGSGGDSYQADVRLENGRIAEIGNLTARDGEKTWDAAGYVLSPGFIDPHSHHDRKLMDNPAPASLLAQGITTIVAGLDGSTNKFGMEYISIADNMAHIEQNPAAVNVAYFSPHNTYRSKVMGDDFKRHATADEIEQMKQLVMADMEAGALGLGAGLEYEPSLYSSTQEVVELAKVASAYGGKYSSHIRSEDLAIPAAYEEIFTIAREANISVNISHIKLASAAMYGKAPEFIAMLDAARQEGLDVTADIYPYDGWQTGMAVLIPSRDYYDREAAEFALTSLVEPSAIIFSGYEKRPDYVGKTLEQVAAEENVDPVDLMMDILQTAEKDGKGASIIGRNMGEPDIAKFMNWPFTAITTDGGIDDRHPRGQGTYARVLGRYVRENGILSLSEAIFKMTNLAAKNLGFKNRGSILEGYIADLVIFDADTIIDHGTFEDPIQYSTGIKAVWVGGELVWDNDAETGARPGKIIRRE